MPLLQRSPPLAAVLLLTARTSRGVASDPIISASNVELVLIAEVSGTTEADFAFWGQKCKAVPRNALYIQLNMGDVIDLYVITSRQQPRTCQR